MHNDQLSLMLAQRRSDNERIDFIGTEASRPFEGSLRRTGLRVGSRAKVNRRGQ